MPALLVHCPRAAEVTVSGVRRSGEPSVFQSAARRFREQDRELDREGIGSVHELRVVGTTERIHPEHHERLAEGGAL